MSSVKIFRIEGRMLISHDRLPTWQKFSIEVRAIKPEDAVEKVLSELGSRHKLKRKHIRIDRVEEISINNVKTRQILALSRLTRWIK